MQKYIDWDTNVLPQVGKDVEKAAPQLRCVARRSNSLIGYRLGSQGRIFENSRKMGDKSTKNIFNIHKQSFTNL